MITLNEAHNMQACLDNLSGFADEIFVVDSFSTDDTAEIARNFGAQIVEREFAGFGDQWNFAVTCLPVQSTWMMKLDPDERLTGKYYGPEMLGYYMRGETTAALPATMVSRIFERVAFPVFSELSADRNKLRQHVKIRDAAKQHPVFGFRAQVGCHTLLVAAGCLDNSSSRH